MSEWQNIATAPKIGSYLVTDGKRQMVAAGHMLWASKDRGVPHHLSGNHWTHWMPLPDLPVLGSPRDEKENGD